MPVINVTVDATKVWMDTGLAPDGTKPVGIEVTGGQWTANPATGMVDANGHAGLIAKPGYNLPGEVEGLLVGRIGIRGDAFAVGVKGAVPTGLSGELFLSTNDDIDGRYGAGFTDNQGSVDVSITVGSTSGGGPL